MCMKWISNIRAIKYAFGFRELKLTLVKSTDNNGFTKQHET